ncbi:MAG: type II toxin-antitoxin system PemK/MazF family toxin [Dehalococcoidia bacterium]|nr:type II toxin-antitoxin system PemK/MazF family toxin [Dehalococcoidia bacterium]
MRKGEVWWANLAPPIGRRPVLLLSRDEAYQRRTLAVAAPITTHMRGILTEVPLGPEEGLPRHSVANLDTLMTIPLRALQEQITTLSHEKLQAVEAAIHFALDLET